METTSSYTGSDKNRYANITKYVNPGSLQSIPSVENQTRFAALPNIFIQTNDKKIQESDFWVADSSFFEIFDFRFLEGSIKTALAKTNSIVLPKKPPVNILGVKKLWVKRLPLLCKMKIYP